MSRSDESPNPLPRAKRAWSLAAGVLTVILLSGCAWYALAQWKSNHARNFGIVVPGELYRSAQPTARQLETLLNDYGIRTVISLRQENERGDDPRMDEETACLQARGITLRRLGTDTPPSPEQLRAIVATIQDGALPKPVLVHCAAGRVRTGAFVALWRILSQGWPREKAIDDSRPYGLEDTRTIEVIRKFQHSDQCL